MQSHSLLSQNDYWNGPFNTVDDIDREGQVAIGVASGVPLRILHIDGNFLFDSPTNFAIETGVGNLFMHNGGDIFNTFNGYNSGATATGTRLTHFGHRAGFRDRGEFNTFAGTQSGEANDVGSFNSFFGAQSGLLNRNGYMNTFIGNEAGRDNSDGYMNTYIGFRSGLSSNDTYNNTAVGSGSLLNNSLGFGNVAVGEGALSSIADRDLNIGIGNSAGRNFSDMTSMVILGSNANENVAHGYNSVVAGNNAFRTGDLVEYSVLMGDGVAQNLETSRNSVILGHQAAANSLDIDKTIIIGDGAALNTQISGSSVVIGDQAIPNIQNMENSVTIGAEIGFASTAISTAQSVVIGWRALPNWTTGVSNIVIGTESAPNLDAGRDNVIIGTTGGINFTDDEQNVMLGNNTEKIGTNPVLHNTLIGHQATVDAGTGGGGAVRQEASAIGYQSEVCDDYTMVLGKHSTTNPTTVVIGDCEPDFATPGSGEFEVVGNIIWSNGNPVPSDERLKKDIKEIENAIDVIYKLTGYTYFFKNEDEIGLKLPTSIQAGLIAQELLENYPYAIRKGGNGYYGVEYDKMIPLLLQGIKEQQDSIVALRAELDELKQDIEDIKDELGISKPNVPGTNPGNSESKGSLKQNAPNPFNEETIISYTIDGDFNQGVISILDFNGQQIRELRINETTGEVRFNGSGYPSGIYFYGLFVDGELLDIKKMIIAK